MKKLCTLLTAVFITFGVTAQTEKGTFSINLNTDIGYTYTKITGTDGVFYDPHYYELFPSGLTISPAWGVYVADDFSTSKFNFDIVDFSSFFENVTLNVFVIDNLSLGLFAKINSTSMEWHSSANFGSSYDVKETINSILLGPKVRYYVNVTDKIAFFPEIIYGIGTNKHNREWLNAPEPDQQDFKTQNSMFHFGLGSSIFIGKKFAIEPVLNYSIMKHTFEDALSELLSSGEPFYYDLITKTKVVSFTINLSFYL
jgi:hypothetical protein